LLLLFPLFLLLQIAKVAEVAIATHQQTVNIKEKTMAFKPGESGNKAGRPKGTPDKRTVLLQQLEADLPALLAKLKDNALGGDTTSLKFLLERLLPLRKASHEPVELPSLHEASTLTDKVNAILSAVADAQLPPDVGAQLVGAIGTAARVEEISELKDRLKALEMAVGQTHGH
jgi:hypothetical protein